MPSSSRVSFTLLFLLIFTNLFLEINSKPGILTLDLEEFKDFHGKTQYRGRPFIVPGGRFNEMYGKYLRLSRSLYLLRLISIQDGIRT